MNKTAWLPGGIKKKTEALFASFCLFYSKAPRHVHHVRAAVCCSHLFARQTCFAKWTLTIWSGNNLRTSLPWTMCWICSLGVYKQKKKKKKKCVHGINQQDRTFLDSLPPECDRYLPHGRAHSNPLGLLTCAHQCSHVDQPLLIWDVQKKKKEKKETGGLILDGSQPSSCHAEQITPGKPFCLFAWSIKDEPAPVMKNPFNQEFISGKVVQWH